ncbi:MULTISPECIES: bacteriocin-like protein [Chryseobacterium]|uniref:bacteriocin-like protein n=1 Tax=Chryseobacterium TaxID=59732 RepID=UPI000AD50057
MKKLKKVTRENLKAIKGGIDYCAAGYLYTCDDMGICEPELGIPCSCRCIPYVP